MNFARVASILSGFALFFTGAQCIPLLVALFGDGPVAPELSPKMGFAAGTGVGFVTAILLWQAGRTTETQFFRRESLAAVGLAWLLAGCLGALPFLWSGAVTTLADGLFESISGLTTTGSTIFGSERTFAIEQLPPSILLWRAQLQWMGGLGIVLVFIVLLPAAGITGKDLLQSEQITVSTENLQPHMREQARSLLLVYTLLTTLAFGLFWLAGQSPFDAISHAMTALATGGFSTRNLSIGAYESVAIEGVAILFMFLAGCNFTLLAAVGRARLREFAILRNPEFRLYAAITAGLVLVVALILWLDGRAVRDPSLGIVRDYGHFGRCLRDAAFQVVSILTSTGYASADFQNWPRAAILLLLVAMLIGGCTGSTAGGFKILRVLILFKLLSYTLRHFIRPKSVEKIKLREQVIPNSIISAALALGVLWLLSIGVGTLALALDPRLDLLTSFSACASAMGCTGPAVSSVQPLGEGYYAVTTGVLNLGPYGSHGDLAAWSKLLLAFQMILGRLEVMTPLVLLAPRFWRQ